MKNKLYAILIAALTLSIIGIQPVFAETSADYIIEWDKSVEMSKSMTIETIIETSDGGYVAVGEKKSATSFYNQDAFIIKLDDKGGLVWEQTKAGSHAYFWNVVETENQEYITVGYDADGGEKKGFVVKYGANGNQIWARDIVGDNQFLDLIRLTDGNYLVVGQTEGDAGNGQIGDVDGLIFKIDSTGNIIWAKNVGTTEFDALVTATIAPDGGFVVVGATEGDVGNGSFGNLDGIIMKFDNDGNQQWAKNVGTADNDVYRAITPAHDGGYLLVGVSEDENVSPSGSVVKVSEDGEQLWEKKIGTDKEKIFMDITKTRDQGYLLVGHVAVDKGNHSGDDSDGIVTKLDKDGQEEWTVNIGDDETNGFNSITQTSDSGYLLAGITINNLIDYKRQGWLVKMALYELQVTFDSVGGSSVQSIDDLLKNSKIAKPADPEKPGHQFKGWYQEATYETEWDFNQDIVTKPIKLYAKWDIMSYRILFETNGGNDIGSQMIVYNQPLVQPKDPVKSGFVFDGWYRDPALTQPYDFNEKITTEMTLYAKWVSETVEIENNQTNNINPQLPNTGVISMENDYKVLMLIGILAIGLVLIRRKHQKNY